MRRKSVEEIKIVPRALHLIQRVECLCKTIRSNFHLNSAAMPDTEMWNIMMNIILNPSENRPKRVMEQVGGINYGFNPGTGTEVDPAVLRENYDVNRRHAWSIMTSVTCLPVDGNMNLFGDGGVGLLLDVNVCNLQDEKFIFMEEAMTSNDWWLRSDAASKDLQEHYKGYTFEELRKETNLFKKVVDTRPYNELLVCVNARSICGIILHPNTQNNKRIITLEERFCAIERKIYISELLGKVFPIIISAPHHGVREYTIEEQSEDILKYLATNPGCPKYDLLFKMFKFNLRYSQLNQIIYKMNEEPQVAYDANRMAKIQPLIDEKLKLLAERNELYRQLAIHEYEFYFYQQHTISNPNNLGARFTEVNERISAITEQLFVECRHDPAALLHERSLCVDSLRIYNYLEESPLPAVRLIREKLIAGTADEGDLMELNLIDIGYMNVDLAFETMAECKIMFIKNRILSQAYPGDIEYEIEGKTVNLTLMQCNILTIIAEAQHSHDPHRFEKCLANIIKNLESAREAGVLTSGNQSPRGQFQQARQHLLQSDLIRFYIFILDKLSEKPMDLLYRLAVTAEPFQEYKK